MILQEVVVGRVGLAELAGLVVLVDRGGLADAENLAELVGLVVLVDRRGLADPENPEELVGLVE